MPPPGPEGQADNGIAVAGLVVSLLGLILSVIVVGGFVGLIAIVLSIIGLRRSRELGGRGRAAARIGIALSLLSMVASVAFVGLLLDTLNGGPPITIDGITTRSTNTEFPPQDDLLDVSCESSESGALGLAVVEIENMSPGESSYAVTVAWDTDSGDVIDGLVRSESLGARESQTLRLFESTGLGLPDTCRVTAIERSGFGLPLGGE